MKKITNRGRLLTSTMLVGSMAMAVMALTAGSAAAADDDLQEIVVTGSRIKQAANLTSDSPLTTVTDTEMKLQGTTNIETLLNRLPGVTADQTQGVSNGASGTATINLRNLGASRTLVLIDGRRMVGGDPSYPYADVNFIPAALVDSVDVVTGGASAVYGSDAVAGVVNFKMKRDFEGVKVDYQLSAAQHDNNNKEAQTALKGFGVSVPGSQFDGFVRDSSFIIGANAPNNRGNVTAYATYRWTEPVKQSSRDWSACSLSVSGDDNDSHVCQGSSNNTYGRFRTNGSGTGLSLNPDGSSTFVPYTNALSYNYGPYNYLQRQDERYTGGAFAHYEISPAFDVYTDFMFMTDHTRAQIAPSAIFNSALYNINCDNPLMSASEATALCGSNAGTSANWSGTIGLRFSGSGMERYDDIRHTDYRYVIGTKGDLGGGWSYDVSAQHSEVIYTEHYENDVSISKVQKALNVVNVNGVATCQSVVDGTDLNCVPLNIFSLNGISSDAWNYIKTTSFKEGNVTQDVVSGSVTGDFGQFGAQSPLAKNPVAIAFGTEYRKEGLNLKVDEENSSGDLAGSGGATQNSSGSYDVKELYGELRVPLIEGREWAKSLVLDAGYRWSDYSSSGTVDSWKTSLTYAPVSDVSFRGGFNRAVRAPSILELYSTQTVGLTSASDPCAGSSPSASLAQCARTGVTAAQYGTIAECTSSQCNVLSGGNTALKPETADTWTIGTVITPTFMHNFSATIDYFDIRVTDLISTLSVSSILNQCLNTGDSYYCGLVHRASNGSLALTGGYIIDTELNTGYLNEQGVDIGLNYLLDLEDLNVKDRGSVLFNFNGTWMANYLVQQQPGESAFNCKGLFGVTCGQPTPMWRHTMRVTWQTPWNFDLSGNWRYIGGVKLDQNTSNALLSGDYDKADGRINSYSYFDIAMSATLYDHYTVRFGVNNLFDKDPPILDSNVYGISGTSNYGNGNTFPGIYDTLGRTFFLGVTADF
ncbi:TonB-dependent receptor-like protein [Nitrospirillum pindoramense]|uniref:TonB-dependent receptor-like protein n=1 Tax=Nitrospirillum amazonense TaxID=28077 RepID=A0A560GX98_9PROT|nr:TonB-dependent receptor-like protein [Nitrospirillum amazonense]